MYLLLKTLKNHLGVPQATQGGGLSVSIFLLKKAKKISTAIPNAAYNVYVIFPETKRPLKPNCVTALLYKNLPLEVLSLPLV